MLGFGRLLSFPLTFKNLEKNIRTVQISDINVTLHDGKFQILSKANNHQVEIIVHSPTLSADAPVQCFCD